MKPLDALELFSRWPESRRGACFNYGAEFRFSDGTAVDGWCEAAVSILDLCGRLDECHTDRDLERELSEAVPAYIESGIIDLEQVKVRSFGLVQELIDWGDSVVRSN